MSKKKFLICLFLILVIISPLEVLIGGEPHNVIITTDFSIKDFFKILNINYDCLSKNGVIKYLEIQMLIYFRLQKGTYWLII